MQTLVEKEFGQRVEVDGHIYIFDNHNGKYYVSCVSPEEHSIKVQLTKKEMNNIARVAFLMYRMMMVLKFFN